MSADAVAPASSYALAEHEPHSAKPLRLSLCRNELFAGLVVVGFTNGITNRVVWSVAENGITAALLGTFDISVIVWSALIISVTFALRGPVQPITRSDLIVAGCAIAAFL